MRLLKTNALLTRLLVRVLAISVLSVGVSIAVAYFQIDRSLEILRTQTVEEQAADLRTYLAPGKSVNKVTFNLPDHIRVFYAKAGPVYQYLVRDERGKVLFRSPFAYPDYFPTNFAELGDGRFEFKGPSGYDNVGKTLDVKIGDKNYYLQVAQTKKASEVFSNRISGDFMARFLWLTVPFHAALLFIIFITLKRAFAPLHSAGLEAMKAQAPGSDFQIQEKDIPDEVKPFVKAINLAFRRLAKSIQEQKELTENLAHELRTPLAVLKANIEPLGRGAQAQKLLRDVDSMTQLVNQMLDMTRLEYADRLEMHDVDLSGVLSQVCQDLWPLFIKEQRELRVQGIDTPVIVRGDRDLIYRAIRNVLDNALEHSPAKTAVDVSIEGCVIKVRDYGPTIPEELRARIFGRLQRLSDRTASRSGAGLGLSIVSRTMEVHGGRASVQPAEEGNVFILDFKDLDQCHVSDSA